MVAAGEVAADSAPHTLKFSVPIDRSSWVALRQFTQRHANPITVIVLGCFDQLWRVRGRRIAASERPEAEKAYDEACAFYRKVSAEAPSTRCVALLERKSQGVWRGKVRARNERMVARRAGVSKALPP